MKHCNKCNLDYDDSFNFCRQCGAPLENVGVDSNITVQETQNTGTGKAGKLLMIALAIVCIAIAGYYFLNVYQSGFETGKYYAAVKVDGRWGFIDENGKYIIKPKFMDVLTASESLIGVEVAGSETWGFIDKSGKLVIKPDFEKVRSFSEGLAAVRVNGKWGFIDKNGKLVIKPQFSYVQSFNDGVCFVSMKTDIVWLGTNISKSGLIDKSGNYIIKPIFRSCNEFKDGRAYVEQYDDSGGYIDTRGKWIIHVAEPSFKTDFSEGLVVIFGENKDLVMDKNGDVIFTGAKDTFAEGYRDGLLRVKSGGKCFFVDHNGQQVIKLGDNISANYWWSEGLNIAFDSKNKKYLGYFNKNGDIVIKTNFAWISDFHDGYALVSDSNKKFGFIDKTGKLVIDASKFAKVSRFNNGFAMVTNNNKYGFINKSGKSIAEPIYDSARNFWKFE
jgi:hypothetical protein